MLSFMSRGLWENAKAEDFEEPVETLEAIEVPGTAVIQEERSIHFLTPTGHTITPLPKNEMIPHPNLAITPPPHRGFRVIQDATGKLRGIRTSVRPAKAERPPYPHFAREQGWEGVVVLRLNIRSDGTVASVATRTSSGHSILDESAEQTVRKWQFEPAKDGEIPIPVTVDLPIRFDLDE